MEINATTEEVVCEIVSTGDTGKHMADRLSFRHSVKIRRVEGRESYKTQASMISSWRPCRSLQSYRDSLCKNRGLVGLCEVRRWGCWRRKSSFITVWFHFFGSQHVVHFSRTDVFYLRLFT